MKILSVFTLVLFFCGRIYAQGEEVSIDVIQSSNTNFQNYGGVMMGKNLPPSKVQGSEYLFEEFVPGKLSLKNGHNLNITPVNYDLFNELIVIKNEKDFYSIQTSLIDEISFENQKFENISGIGEHSGIVEILYENKSQNISLWKKHYLYIKDPTYIPGVDIGNRDSEIIKKSRLLGVNNGRVFELKNKSDLQSMFDGNGSILRLIKDEKLTPKKEQQLVSTLSALLD